MKDKKVFYGWFVVLGGLIIMITIGGVAWNCVSQFTKPVCADLGFTRQAMSTNETITALISMAISLSWGTILKKYSLKKLMRAASIALPIAYCGYSFCSSIWMFYLCSVFTGLSLAVLMNLPLSLIISNWFDEKKGLAFGITFMGSGLGGMIFNPIVANLIINLGWRMTYRIMAAMMLVAGTFAVFVLIKIRPEEMGLKPLGYKEIAATETEPAHAPEPEGMMLGELLKTTKFWVTAFVLCFCSTAMGCIAQLLSPHLSDNGYTVQMAAYMVSIGMGSMAVGKIILGGLFDKFGTRRTTLFSFTCGLIGIGGMYMCKYPIALLAIFLGQGLGCSFGTVGTPIVVQSLFGKRDYAAIFGFISACTSLGRSLSPMINGASFDKLGSYNPAFILWGALMAFGIAAMFAILPRDNKKEAA